MAVRVHIDTRLHAIACYVGKDEMAVAEVGQTRHQLVGTDALTFAPTIHTHLPVPSGHIGHHEFAKLRCSLPRKRRVSHKRRAYGNALGASRCQSLDRREVTDPAARIDRDARHLTDGPDRCSICRSSLFAFFEGCREVHHMNPRCTATRKVLGHGHRIGGVHIHLRPFAST